MTPDGAPVTDGGKAYRAILTMIGTGELKATGKVDKKKIRELIGAGSDVPVEEAIHRLDEEGILVTKANKGTYVNETSDSEMAEILMIRFLVEPHLAGVCAECAASDVIGRLEEIHEQLCSADRDDKLSTFLERDTEFHRFVSLSAGFGITSSILGRTRYKTVLYYYSRPNVRIHRDDVIKEHLAIINSIRASDKSKTEQSMRDHLEQSARRMGFDLDRPGVATHPNGTREN